MPATATADPIDNNDNNNNNNKSFEKDNEDEEKDYNDEYNVPKNMVEALEFDDPCQALLALSRHSSSKAQSLSKRLSRDFLEQYHVELPELFLLLRSSTTTSTTTTTTTTTTESAAAHTAHHPIATAVACSDSILHSLTKIASGGTQASQEIKQLEQSKRELEQHAKDVETALILRRASDMAAQSLSAQRYETAAQAIQEYLYQKQQNQNQNQKQESNNNNEKDGLTERAKAYAGEYTITQLESTQRALRAALLEQYQQAVEQSNMMELGKLTPLVQMVQMEEEAVGLYLRFLKELLTQQIQQKQQQQQQQSSNKNKNTASSSSSTTPPYVPMANVYNVAFTTLRHHLPMVSHCLYKANGDAAVIQLVHVQVEQAVTPMFQNYMKTKQLPLCSKNAQRVYNLLEDRYSTTGGGGGGSTGHASLSESLGLTHDDHHKSGTGPIGSTSGAGGGGAGSGNMDPSRAKDCGFSTMVGTLADVDVAMEEVALLLQHAESYTRFIHHTISEVNKARSLRHLQEQKERRMERERSDWSSGMSSSSSSSNKKNSSASPMRETEKNTSSNYGGDDDEEIYRHDDDGEDDDEVEYKPLQILPSQTQLQETVAEVGGYYSAIERCLLLASMQRAFVTNDGYDDDDDDQNVNSSMTLSPLGESVKRSNSSGGGGGGNTHNYSSSFSLVGNKAVQTSVVETCLYATRRGVQRAFATGHTGTASAMANYAADCLRGVLVEYLAKRAEDWGISALKPGEGLLAGSAGIFNASNLIRQGQTVSNAVGGVKVDEMKRRQEIEQGIAFACATLNDLEVAAHHTAELEKILDDNVNRGFPAGTHETEQLRMCVKSFAPVAELFQLTSNNAIESLVSVLKPRIRAIVTDSVGGDASGTAAFSVMGGSKTTDRHAVRMNYDLNEEAYQLLEVSEGYISRLCTCLDELILPLSAHLAPRLSDELVLGVLGTVAKRLEVSIKKCRFTSLGALSLDSDMRDLLNYSKDRLDSNEFQSNASLYRACTPLSRLVQIAKLMNVDDLDDVLDLISASKRKGNWDLKLDDAKSFLSLRVDFESERINELLRIPDEE